MTESAKIKLAFTRADGEAVSKFIYNVNPAAQNSAIVTVGKELEKLQQHSLTALSKTISTELDLTAAGA